LFEDIKHCHACSKRVGINCSVGDDAPVFISVRADKGICPLGIFYSPPADPLDQSLWPPRFQNLARKRIPTDKGVGDTLERRYARFGGRLYKWVWKLIGKPCSCENEQAWLNARFPYAAHN